jgi:hypothetical protein
LVTTRPFNYGFILRSNVGNLDKDISIDLGQNIVIDLNGG